MKAFVLMPFGDPFDAVYERLVKPPLETVGFEVSRADSSLDQRNVLKDIIVGIAGADLLVADLTGRNANVFYELGVAHGLELPTVLMAQSLADVPFDLRSYRVHEYSLRFDETDDFSNRLRTVGEARRQDAATFENPLTDFRPEHRSTGLSADQSMVDVGEHQQALQQFGEAFDEVVRLQQRTWATIEERHGRRLKEVGAEGSALQAEMLGDLTRGLLVYVDEGEPVHESLEDAADTMVRTGLDFARRIDLSEEDNRTYIKQMRTQLQNISADAEETVAVQLVFVDELTKFRDFGNAPLARAVDRALRSLDRETRALEKAQAYAIRFDGIVNARLATEDDQALGAGAE
jgi:hypothetical protein